MLISQQIIQRKISILAYTNFPKKKLLQYSINISLPFVPLALLFLQLDFLTILGKQITHTVSLKININFYFSFP